MANLYLTHKCNRGCPFCFARKVLKESGGNINELLTIEEIEQLINHYKGEFQLLGLLGGEPFLYPYFGELLDLLQREKIHAKIFTSATNPMPAALEAIPLEDAATRFNFIANVAERNTYSDEKFANRNRFFKHFGPLTSLSFTIFDLKADPTYLFDMIDEYDLNRDIRVGIALPIYNGGNEYIPLDKYKEAADYFVKAVLQAAERQISLSMDCGFVACMFTEEQIGILERHGSQFNFLCGAALDFGPNLECWNCFPLFQMGRVKALEAKSLEELKGMLAKQNEKILGPTSGVFPECATCDLRRRGLCQGGCKSFKSLT